MKKWNAIGFFAFLAIEIFWAATFVRDISLEFGLVMLILFNLAGITLIGLDRLAGTAKLGILVTVLWVGYWAVTALDFFSLAGAYGLAIGMGSGNYAARRVVTIYMVAYIGVSLLFSAMVVANIVKFISELFSIPNKRVE